jgi:hypothetical protein
VINVVFTCYISTESFYFCQPSLHGEWWTGSCLIVDYTCINSFSASEFMLLVAGPFLQHFLRFLICFIMFMVMYFEWLTRNPLSLLEVTGVSFLTVYNFFILDLESL